MRQTTKLWLPSLAVYGLFVLWYTDFSGPLNDEEVDHFVATLMAHNSAPETITYIERFLRNDTGRQFLMLNNLDMADNPSDVEGAQPGESAEQLMNRYMEHMYPELLKRASHPVIFGQAIYSTLDMTGIENTTEMKTWTDGALFRYRSRRTFMEIVANPELKGRHEFKLAALNKTIAYPIETSIYLGDLRLLIGLILLSLTALLDNFRLARRS
ncbi:MAG: hypothetical protein P8O13_05770 [Porticoccaceae bacterium]|jgi:hypothetical protein|nr:hypothetical protein [Porticoccaceae bacterium]